METQNGIIMQIKAGILIGLCLLTRAVQASLAIQPAFLEVNLDKGRPSGTFLLSNLGDTEERFRINAVPVNYTEEGALSQSPTGKYSLAPWIHFNPRELTIAPKTQRAVRFAIVPREKLTEGEWWAAMELESLATNEIVTKNDKSGQSVKLKAITKVMVPIFGTVGETSYEGQIKDFRLLVEEGTVAMKVLVAATGTGRLRLQGNYEIADTSGTMVDSGPFATGYVFRGEQRWFTRRIETALPQGEYTVRLNVEALHLEQPLTKETAITWPQVPRPEAQANGPAMPSVSETEQDQSPNPMDGTNQSEVQGSTGS